LLGSELVDEVVVEGAEAARGFAQSCRRVGRGPRQGRHGFDLRIDMERGTGLQAPKTGLGCGVRCAAHCVTPLPS
jgi:hypothetical protein